MTDSPTWRHQKLSDMEASGRPYSSHDSVTSSSSQHPLSPSDRDCSVSAYSQEANLSSTRPQLLAPLLPPPPPPPSFSPNFSPTHNRQTTMQSISPSSPNQLPRAQLDSGLHMHQQTSTPRSDPAYTSSAQLGQRRTFRQRRKDPSCDSCRDRKVKCDATDNASCSECSQRGVKCQFTKDTNRRMTSTKQVSDLERQLVALKKENQHLRALWQKNDTMELDGALPATRTGHQKPLISFSSSYKRSEKFQETHRHLSAFSEDVFDISFALRNSEERDVSRDVELDVSSLPAPDTCLNLLDLCRNCPHPCLSAVNWQIYSNDIESFKRSGRFFTRNHDNAAISLALFAFGTLLAPMQTGKADTRPVEQIEYIHRAVRYCSDWEGRATKDTCLAALLISACWLESGLRSSAWIWLSIAVAIASNIGILGYGFPAHSQESIQERNILKSVILWDRLLSLDMSKSALIDPEDYRFILSESLHSMQSTAVGKAPVYHGYESYRWMARLISSIHSFVQIQQALRLHPIPPNTIQDFEKHINILSESLNSNDARHLAFSTLPYSLQIILHRPQISPMQPMGQRKDALEKCLVAAQKTAHIIETTVEPIKDTGGESRDGRPFSMWKDKLCSTATSFLCTHVWRCILILCTYCDFDSAITCVRVGSIIGNSRRTNVACSWSIYYFLQQLSARIASGQAHVEGLLNDTEMLAYVSADLQGDPRCAWLWDGQAGFVSSSTPPDVQSFPPFSYSPQLDHGNTKTSGQSSREEHSWHLVTDLLSSFKEQIAKSPPKPPVPFFQQPKLAAESLADVPTSSPHGMLVDDSPAINERLKVPGNNVTGSGGSEMMSIKNII